MNECVCRLHSIQCLLKQNHAELSAPQRSHILWFNPPPSIVCLRMGRSHWILMPVPSPCSTHLSTPRLISCRVYYCLVTTFDYPLVIEPLHVSGRYWMFVLKHAIIVQNILMKKNRGIIGAKQALKFAWPWPGGLKMCDRSTQDSRAGCDMTWTGSTGQERKEHI